MHYPAYLRERAEDCAELARIAAEPSDAELLGKLAVTYQLWADEMEEAESIGTSALPTSRH
jgi:hypothetical protein